MLEAEFLFVCESFDGKTLHVVGRLGWPSQDVTSGDLNVRTDLNMTNDDLISRLTHRIKLSAWVIYRQDLKALPYKR